MAVFCKKIYNNNNNTFIINYIYYVMLTQTELCVQTAARCNQELLSVRIIVQIGNRYKVVQLTAKPLWRSSFPPDWLSLEWLREASLPYRCKVGVPKQGNYVGKQHSELKAKNKADRNTDRKNIIGVNMCLILCSMIECQWNTYLNGHKVDIDELEGSPNFPVHL